MKRLENITVCTMYFMAQFPRCLGSDLRYPAKRADGASSGDVDEVIIATNSSLKGDYCDVYQQTDQADRNQGQPDRKRAGRRSDLEYIDEVTLLRALEGRTAL